MNVAAERRRVPTRRPAELGSPEPERFPSLSSTAALLFRSPLSLEQKRCLRGLQWKLGSVSGEVKVWWSLLQKLTGQLEFGQFMEKRMCISLETVPHSISKYAVDYWDMEQDSTQKSPVELSSSPVMKEKPHYMIFPDNETRTTPQACLRCMAGESGHFGHIMGL